MTLYKKDIFSSSITLNHCKLSKYGMLSVEDLTLCKHEAFPILLMHVVVRVFIAVPRKRFIGNVYLTSLTRGFFSKILKC